MPYASPIVLIWAIFVATIFDLLSRLELFSVRSSIALETSIGIGFVVCAVIFWRTFRMLKLRIEAQVSEWEDSLKNDIRSFLKIRAVRLASSLSFAIVLFAMVFSARFANVQGPVGRFVEILFYVYVISLFHVSLISTLVFSKLIRTLVWTIQENKISEIERP